MYILRQKQSDCDKELKRSRHRHRDRKQTQTGRSEDNNNNNKETDKETKRYSWRETENDKRKKKYVWKLLILLILLVFFCLSASSYFLEQELLMWCKHLLKEGNCWRRQGHAVIKRDARLARSTTEANGPGDAPRFCLAPPFRKGGGYNSQI